MYFDADEVENVRKVFNQEHPKEPIPKSSPQKVWSTLQARLRGKCAGSGTCVVASLLEKPRAPASWKSNPAEWVSSDDIDKLETRFEKVFKGYKHVGTFPIDFDKHTKTCQCLVSTLCSMNIRTLYEKGYHQLGLVFNTDKSTGPGQHWFAVFCDLRPDLVYPRMTYFDSYAHKPEPEIQTLMKRWKTQWDATHIHSKPMRLTYNGTRHQFEDSECGLYSLYFHYCCLLGIPMETRIPDEVVRGLRGMLFKV